MIRHLTMGTKNTSSNGFTIVELLVVIVVIGILAAISVIAFNGVQKRASIALVQSDLRNAATAIRAAEVESGAYPTAFPSSVKASPGVGLAFTESAETFCINGTHERFDDIAWHVNGANEPREGLCTGAVVVASIIGTYNDNASGEEDEETPPTQPVQNSAGLAIGDGGGFRVSTNDDWTEMRYTWDAVPDATRYELQYRTTPSGTWYLATLDTGAGPNTTASSGNSTSHSAQIPTSTTSLTWTDTATRPTATATYQYRVRAHIGSTPSTWRTASLSHTATVNFPTPTSFAVTPNQDWTNHTISWSADTTTMPAPMYELHYRTTPSGTWYLASMATGSGPGPLNTYVNDAGYTAQIPRTTNSFTWTDPSTRPINEGQTYQYRVRIKSGTVPELYGPWATATLSPAANNTYPTIQNFTVTPNSNWTSHTISWDGVNIATTVPSPRYDLQYRTTASASWRFVTIASGGNAVGVSGNHNDDTYTGRIPVNITSFVWTDGSTRPSNPGQTYYYQIRVKSTTLNSVNTNWTSTSLTR